MKADLILSGISTGKLGGSFSICSHPFILALWFEHAHKLGKARQLK